MKQSNLIMISIAVVVIVFLLIYFLVPKKEEKFVQLVGNIDSAHMPPEISREGRNMKKLAACFELCSNIDPSTSLNPGKGSLYCANLCDQMASSGTMPDFKTIGELCEEKTKGAPEGEYDYCVGMSNLLAQAMEDCRHEVTSIYQNTDPRDWGQASGSANGTLSSSCVRDAVNAQLPNLYLGSWIRR